MKNSYLLYVATCLNSLSSYGYACEDILVFPCLSWHMTKQNVYLARTSVPQISLYSTVVGIIQAFGMLCSLSTLFWETFPF